MIVSPLQHRCITCQPAAAQVAGGVVSRAVIPGAADRLTKLSFSVRIGFLPKGKDPAEVSAETVRHAIRNAPTYSKSLGVKIRLTNPYGV
jgi:hypothetical protein